MFIMFDFYYSLFFVGEEVLSFRHCKGKPSNKAYQEKTRIIEKKHTTIARRDDKTGEGVIKLSGEGFKNLKIK